MRLIVLCFLAWLLLAVAALASNGVPDRHDDRAGPVLAN